MFFVVASNRLTKIMSIDDIIYTLDSVQPLGHYNQFVIISTQKGLGHYDYWPS